MAIRQYIGARYVLKIYENSQNPQSADWEANTSYEPLTMVNYNNSSYISRKDVPANIGDPVANPTYWALSGLYNGQIASLQNQINDINDEVNIIGGVQNFINKFANKKFCIYGDSLSSQALSDDWVVPFTALMTSLGSTVTNHSVAGGTMTNANIYAAGDTSTYDYVIIWCGINDANAGTPLGALTITGTFSNLYHELITKIRAVSPNAKIFTFGLSYTNNSNRFIDSVKSLLYYNNCLETTSEYDGVIFKTMLGLTNNGFANNTATSDGLHFTQSYSEDVIFHRILSALCTEISEPSPEYQLKYELNTITVSEPSKTSIVGFNSSFNNNGTVTIAVLFDVSTTLTAGPIMTFAIGPLPDQTIYDYNNGQLLGIDLSGNLISGPALAAGRYYGQFTYIPKYFRYYNSGQ